MPRAYTVATAALALDMPAKWVDNVLSHYFIHGVRQERQGVARRLTIDGLMLLALTALLTHDLGIPAGKAIAVAEDVVRGGGSYTSSQGLHVELDLASFRADLLEQLEHAVEIAPIPRRGRPRENKTGRLD